MNELNPVKKFLLVSIVPQKLSQEQAFADNQEAIRLVETFGGQVVDIVLQNREIHDRGHFIGTGKAKEISQLLTEKEIDIVLLNGIIKPNQIYHFQEMFEAIKPSIEVWDRVDLILKIFDAHANTSEAKLQIELASMRHMGPRIYGMGIELSRQSGQLGTRGIGETNTEIMKRHLAEHTKLVKKELQKITKNRQSQLDNRHQAGLPTVSLVGYTNAGKTSLFNRLTGKDRLIQDALFVTLDTVTGKMFSQELNKEIIVSDTIGFIHNLPPELIDAFSSTLLESVHADILLHVIDATDPDIDRKMETVEVILRKIKVQPKKRLFVFNKADKLSPEQKAHIQSSYQSFEPIFVSVKTSEGIDDLKKVIGEELQTSN
jgi:GTP-binding protein HflX